MEKVRNSTFYKVCVAVILVFLIATVVIAMADMPVASEGEQLTKAQNTLVWLKHHVDELYLALGISASTVCIAIGTILSKNGKTTKDTSEYTASAVEKASAKIDETDERVAKIEKQLANQNAVLEAIANVFVLSDAPKSAREKLQTAVDKSKTVDFEGVIKAVTEKVTNDDKIPVQTEKAEKTEKETAKPALY